MVNIIKSNTSQLHLKIIVKSWIWECPIEESKLCSISKTLTSEKQLQIGCQETLIPSPDHSLQILYEKIHFQYYSLCNHCTQESVKKKISKKMSLGRLVGVISVAPLIKTCRSISLFFKLCVIAFR